MALNEEDLGVIAGMLAAPPADGQLFAALRARFPALSFTRCDASDVVEAPFGSFGGYDVHLMDARDHCVQLTDDPARATGVVIAKRSDAS